MTRPSMPYGDTAADQQANRTIKRFLVLSFAHDQVAKEWIDKSAGMGLSSEWEPDLSVNTLWDNATSFAALYSQQVTATHLDPAALPMVAPGGYLDAYWPSQQYCQFMALGLGDWIRAPEAVEDRLVNRHVRPCDVWIRSDPRDPRRILEIWEMRDRLVTVGDRTYTETCWDVWLIERGANTLKLLGDGPSYRTLLPGGDSEGYTDITAQIHRDEDGAPRSFDGGRYPWVRADGSLRVPHVIYSPVDDGQVLHPTWMRGAYHGALNAIMLQSSANRSALLAGASPYLSWGLKMPFDTEGAGTPESRRLLRVGPGAIIEAAIDPELKPGIQPTCQKMAGGEGLETAVKYSAEYQAAQAKRWGAGQSSAERSGASPWSGAALTVSNHDRRLQQEKFKPIFRRGDLDYLASMSVVLRAAGIAEVPEDGYALEYPSIPMTPDEAKQEQESLAFQRSAGLISPQQEYMALHPGMSEAQAEEALVRIAVAKAHLDRLISEAVAKEKPEPVEPAAPAPEPTPIPETPAEEPMPEGAEND